MAPVGSAGHADVKALSTRAIAIGAVVAVAAGVVGFVLLLHFLGAGTEADKIRIDAVRTAGSVMLGTGGAIALFLAARRQRYSELTLRQQTESMRISEADATERRGNDLYGSACDQLASERPTVRLAGLYALGRLGDSYPDFRPIIIDILCAYLRMPFKVPSWFPSVGPPVELNGDESSASRSFRKIDEGTMETVEAAVDNDIEQAQELEVRYVAQRILSSKIREPGRTDGATSWTTDGIKFDIDLTNAKIVQAVFSYIDVRSATFQGARFFGNSMFEGARFSNWASFRDADFRGLAWFNDAKFGGRAIFKNCTFRWTGQLFNASFSGNAFFDGVRFQDRAHFMGSSFDSSIVFDNAQFCNGVDFSKATVKKRRKMTFSNAAIGVTDRSDGMVLLPGLEVQPDEARSGTKYAVYNIIVKTPTPEASVPNSESG